MSAPGLSLKTFRSKKVTL